MKSRTLRAIKRNPKTAGALVGQSVRIWSGERGAWWRKSETGGGCGYTDKEADAGVWTFAEAIERAGHCGPEKQIRFEVVEPENPTSEGPLMRRIQVALTAGDHTRVFRNNVGTAYQGQLVQWGDGPYKGPVVLKARAITFGLCEGSGDLIGWQTIEITPDMVGRSVAVFTSLEVKTTSGRVKPEQEKWARVVNDAGGIALVCRSEETAPMELAAEVAAMQRGRR